MAIIKTNRLNMTGGGVPMIVRLSQYDADFTLIFELYSTDGTFTIPSGTTAEVRGTKNDGKGYSASATLDITNKKVTVTGDQQMTAVAGRNIFELTLTKNNKELNTANFILDVERAALDRDTIKSDSVIRELYEVIDQADEIIAAAQQVEDALEVIDPSLTQSGKAADAKATGDAISDLYSKINTGAMPDDIKETLLMCFRNVAWINEESESYYNELYEALYPDSGLVSISCVFTQGSLVVEPTTPLDDLKMNLVVTGHYKNGSSHIETNYTLSGTLTIGESTITVSKEGKTTTFTVNVSGELPSGYTPYDYIELKTYDEAPSGAYSGHNNAQVTVSGTSAYIFTPSYSDLNKLSIEIKAKVNDNVPSSLGSQGVCIIGGRSASGETNSFALYVLLDKSVLAGHSHGTNHWFYQSFDGVTTFKLVNKSVSPSELYIDSNKETFTWTNSQTIPNTKLSPFTNKAPNISDLYANVYIQVGRFTLTDLSGSEVGKFVPAIRESDNVIGLYDLVTEAFYTCSNTAYATVGGNKCIYKVGTWGN